ncbi:MULTISPECIES: BTAD domain-containing putative transcriptional regulator [Streptomyces]|uniref:OmpR/PhoB-type domain-containing protein n=1 Tax=Streptomyces luteosporeus TaxID=173856 RepID=A0ABP6G0U8_9ACTN
MLGPLELVDHDRPLALGGIKQRATLAFLLLHANRVVATSQLLKALWPTDEAPTSARKILQNAVWGLRGVLTAEDGAPSAPALLTQAPGYVLRVDPEDVDLHRFLRQVEQGRSRLASGAPQEAAVLLRESLTLWQGPALSDLVETGIAWPELAAVEKGRLDAMEDYFEAELACGRHRAVLGELETMVATEPLRERSCGQLMLALYRCGRQADALAVYDRVRSTLVEELGLEPGRSLRSLQHAILTHDPELSPVLPPAPAEPYTLTREPAPAPEPVREAPVRHEPQPPAARPALTPVAASGPGEREATVTERTQISVALIATELDCDEAAGPGGVCEKTDTALESVAAAIQEKAEYFGGTVVATIGPVSLVAFGVHDDDRYAADAAERAVHAGLAVRAALGSAAYAAVRPARRPAVRAAVVTGEAIVRHRPDDPAAPPTLIGSLLHNGQALLSRVPAGEIRVCATTRQRTEGAIVVSSAGDAAGGWEVRGTRREYPGERTVPIVDRDCELDLLGGLLGRTRHRAVPHLVTVLGDPGIGKTRLVAEFERIVAEEAEPPLFLVGRTPSFPEDNALAVHGEILAAACGIVPGESDERALGRLAATVGGAVADPAQAHSLVELLTPLVTPGAGDWRRTGPERARLLHAWRHLLVALAARRPLVLVVDDLHRAEDALLDCVEELVESAAAVPLLVVAAARPELLQRRPGWGAGRRHATTIGLDPLSDAAIDRLVEFLLAGDDSLRDAIGEETAARRSHLRKLLASGAPTGTLHHLYGRLRRPLALAAQPPLAV